MRKVERTLADFIDVPACYTAGRLDYDSEGLLLLTDDGALQARIAHPKHKLEKVYAVQVEGTPVANDARSTDAGCHAPGRVESSGQREAERPSPRRLPPRDPPIPPRHRESSSWVSVVLDTGKNRQVRRMLAAVGHPVLRLVTNPNRTVEARRSGARGMERGSGAPAALIARSYLRQSVERW